MPVDYLPTPVPPIDSSSSSRGEGEEEATICVCLACGSKESCFLIKSGSALPPPDSSPSSWESMTISRPNFTKESRCGCAVVAVGSIIYVIGGDRRGERGGSAEVFWLDTLDASEEWKIGPPMASKRSNGCSAFSIDGKIYVMGGNSGPPFAEVLNTNNKGGRWTGIWANSIILQALPVVICSPGVFNKKVFAHAPHSSDLYCYDTVTDTWSVFDDSFGCHKRDSALVDGVLYYLDYTVPGELFGLDVSAPGPRCRKKRVKIDGWGFPRADPFEPVHPMLYLVSAGRVKLAVFWLTLSRIPHRVIHVNCSIFKMSKTLNGKGKIKSLNANFDSYICLHAESCGMIRHCLPLFSTQKTTTNVECMSGNVKENGNSSNSNNSCNKKEKHNCSSCNDNNINNSCNKKEKKDNGSSCNDNNINNSCNNKNKNEDYDSSCNSNCNNSCDKKKNKNKKEKDNGSNSNSVEKKNKNKDKTYIFRLGLPVVV